jgi:choline dehydrogenase-like flavoprotein/pimeloyl-ACP methyl ester carboxylesterase
MENEKHGSDDEDDRPHVARWLSQGFEDLLLKLGRRESAADNGCDFEFVIVGSGYGGALAAAQLSGLVDPKSQTPYRLCVLERGREYLSGMFPVSEAELPGHIRISGANKAKVRGKADGLLDLRVGKDVCALVANGLGGGSLINAGVMARPTDAVLRSDAWPQQLREGSGLADFYAEAERMLAPRQDRGLNRFDQLSDDRIPPKFQALKELRSDAFTSAPLSIAIDGGKNSAGVELNKCLGCGDCATGCNHQAKNSLDQNCLVSARRRGAEIYCGATVLKLEPLPAGQPGWKLHVVHTDPDLRRRGTTLELRARVVILAAGTFGSTEILLRSRSPALRFSPCLGQRFSTNGDLLAVSYNQKKEVNAVVQETIPFDKRRVGPTITGMIDRRAGAEGIAIQEFAIPGALRRLFAESFTLADTFYRLSQSGGRHVHGSNEADPCGVNPEALKKTQVFGLMGDDGAAGTLALVSGCSDDSPDGAIRVHWSSLRTNDGTTIFDKQVDVLREMVRDAGQGGVVLPNPIWRLLPQELESIVDIPRGPALTVHPLGGCTMGSDARYGVVDHCGRVFIPDFIRDWRVVHDETYENLVVLDGSIIPCALGINPALTIAAVALRALHQLRKTYLPEVEQVAGKGFNELPRLRQVKVPELLPTEIRILERMKGELRLELADSYSQIRIVELTLAFQPQRVEALSGTFTRRLEIDADTSRIRIFAPDCYDELWRTGASEVRFDRSAKFIAPVTGHMLLLDREASTAKGRTCRALAAWFVNRGLRDLWQRWRGMLHRLLSERSRGPRNKNRPGVFKRIGQFLKFASHAGETRLFEYELVIGPAIAGETERYSGPLTGRTIRGVKRLTYSLACNPWLQLTELKLTEFPNLLPCSEAVLRLEPKYYARQEKHLLEIVKQRDHATALFELTSFLFCVLRMLLTTHIWSFRLPDAPSVNKPQRLPGKVPGLPEPQINEIEVGTPDRRARIRLTRYVRPDARADVNPVVMIHGFSANGTTFAHPALRPSLASYLCKNGRDVWILDLRTSSGLLSSREKWSFEEVANGDIPAAFAFIRGATQKKQIDVVAHCMGSAMLSMAILDSDLRCMDVDDPERIPALWARRPAFLESIGSVVLSQVGPLIVFSPENIYRAYVVSFVQQALEDRTFELRPDEGLTSNLLDRLLSSVPYPRREFRLENPLTPWKRTPFVGTRHRMDAWFGRVLNLENVHPRVLEHIDDMFGTINLHTTFQTIHFARQGMITTRKGRNAFVTPDTLNEWKRIPTLSIHGRENKLVDVATVTRMHMLMDSLEGRYESHIANDLGHQDCMIGRDAGKKIFPQILAFLNDPKGYRPPFERPSITAHGGVAEKMGPMAEVPWLGPVLDERDDTGWKIAVAPNPKLGQPAAVAVVPVQKEEGRWQMQGALSGRHIIWLDQPIYCGVQFTDEQRWYEVKLSNHWDDTNTVLVLLVYNQAPVVGKPPLLKPRLREMDQEMSRAAIRRAIDAYLNDVSAEELRAGLMTRPPQDAASAEHLSFAAASCQYPPGPLDPTLAGDSYRRLHDLLGKPNAPEFLVLSGDQVYVDATNGLMDPSAADDRYELPYEKFLRAPSVRRVLKRLPVYTMLDDHEIENNWEPGVRSSDEYVAKMQDGKRAYLKFQRPLNAPDSPVVWYEKSLRGFPFFFADTRTERQARTALDIDNARIMDHEACVMDHMDPKKVHTAQFRALTSWLEAHKNDPTPVFVVSPAILLPRHLVTKCSKASALCSDAWDGFPYSFRRLLAHIAREQIHNVVFLSGDEHHSCIASAKLTARDPKTLAPMGSVMIHLIHSSALYAPYVFANGTPADLAGDEAFEFDDPDTKREACTISCEVRTDFAPCVGSGFAVIECERAEADRWQLRCKFHIDGCPPMPARDIRVTPPTPGSGAKEKPHAA